MTNLTPILTGLLLSGAISIGGSPVMADVWGPVNPASTVFVFIAIAIRLIKIEKGQFTLFLATLAGMFIMDILMSKFFVTASNDKTGLKLLLGSVSILLFIIAVIFLIGWLSEERKGILYSYIIMAFIIYLYGLIYGGITPGVSDGPKLAVIVSIILLKLRRYDELRLLWGALFIMGILGNFIIPFISKSGLIGETF